MKPRTRHALVIAHGDPPPVSLLRSKIRQCDFIVCADGGANTAAALNVRPHAIVGDLDSVRPRVLRSFRDAAIVHRPDQENTDLEKTLDWVISRGYRTITVLGATGGRPDHAAGNLGTLIRFAHRASICFQDRNGTILPVGRSLVPGLPRGTTVSLLPLTRCSGVRTRGLRWNLNGEVLSPGVRESRSNVVVSSSATVTVQRGTLLLFILQTSANGSSRSR